jgi:Sulfotransferase family
MEPVAELLAAARTQAGLDDFGDDTFREGLERLVGALRTESRLNEVGEHSLRALIIKLLGNRLQIEDWYRRHPEIADEPVERPLITLGLPRTGSSALSFLLAEDPGTRFLRLWEAGEPCPPPSTVTGPDPRIARAEAQLRTQDQMAPRMAALVPSTATGPEECQDLMGLDFKSQYFQAMAHVPSYSAWLMDADLTPTYAYERRALKLLQWGAPARPWRLKCPTHLMFLGHLDQAFPDARFVMTHRDPTEVLVSVVTLYTEIRQMFSDDVDLAAIGQVNVEQWTLGMRRALEFRDAGHDDRFFDMDFRAVQRAPLEEVRRLYDWLGEPVTPEFDAGMRRWWHENAESRERTPPADPATYGIDLEKVRPLFADYVARAAQWTAPRNVAGQREGKTA